MILTNHIMVQIKLQIVNTVWPAIIYFSFATKRTGRSERDDAVVVHVDERIFKFDLKLLLLLLLLEFEQFSRASLFFGVAALTVVIVVGDAVAAVVPPTGHRLHLQLVTTHKFNFNVRVEQPLSRLNGSLFHKPSDNSALTKVKILCPIVAL